MKSITITLTDNETIQTEASEPLSFEDMLDLTLSATLGVMNTIKQQAQDTKEQEQLEEYLFAMFNDAASALLAQFAPDLDLRPDITAEAIMELEDQQLQNKTKTKGQ